MKYILVSGGVVSGVGKGIIASSVGLLLKTTGLSVTMIKIDPYMNVDAGTMAPAEHGEVFVLKDGGEVDLDLGNYERYLSIALTSKHNITTGKIYQHVIDQERRGDFLGKTVQIVPHLVDAIVDWIVQVAQIPVDDTGRVPDVCVIELGGTAGDMENAPFLEALRRLRARAGKDNFLHILVTLIPIIMNREQKTKPTQAAMRDVLQTGLRPDLVACRCEIPLEDSTVRKVAETCDLEINDILVVHNVESTYHVPALLQFQGTIPLISSRLRLDNVTKTATQIEAGNTMWTKWTGLTMSRNHYEEVTIALVGKYVESMDAYMSVQKALEHAAMAHRRKLNLKIVNSARLEPDAAGHCEAWATLRTADGIIVPGGFGPRGVEGKIAAARWARENGTPYLGICLGMQIAVIEYARNVCEIPAANSAELCPGCEHPVIIAMSELDKLHMGGTMRLGLRATEFQTGTEWSRLRKLYDGQQTIEERHRHRYEVNPDYVERLSSRGLHFVGKDTSGVRMEVIELKDHPWYVGVQYHPEYQSRVLDPSKPYLGFVAAAISKRSHINGAVHTNGTAHTDGEAHVNGGV